VAVQPRPNVHFVKSAETIELQASFDNLWSQDDLLPEQANKRKHDFIHFSS